MKEGLELMITINQFGKNLGAIVDNTDDNTSAKKLKYDDEDNCSICDYLWIP